MSTDMSASTAPDEPLRGVKAGRLAVLPSGVAFTALHASDVTGSPVAYPPEAEMTCLCGYAEQPTVMGAYRSGRWHERPDPKDGHCGFVPADGARGRPRPVSTKDLARLCAVHQPSGARLVRR